MMMAIIIVVLLFFTFIIVCVYFVFNHYRSNNGGNHCRTHAFQTGGCDDCFPDPNFPVDDDDDFTRNGLTVAVYVCLFLGFRLIDSLRNVYDTTISTDTSNTANTFTTIGSLFKCNFFLMNSDIIGSPPLKHEIVTNHCSSY